MKGADGFEGIVGQEVTHAVGVGVPGSRGLLEGRGLAEGRQGHGVDRSLRA